MNDYVARILGNLGDRPAMDSLRETRDEIEALSNSIAMESRWGISYGEGKWTARELISHLADTEMVIGFRMRQVVAMNDAVIQPIDQNAWARGYQAANPRLAVPAFLSLRNWNLSFLKGLPPSAWERPYHHPEQGDLTFSILVRLLAGHDINHLAQLEKIGAK